MMSRQGPRRSRPIQRRGPAEISALPASWQFWAAVLVAFLALALWRREVIALPPFYETAMGLFREANFLADTNFDYMRLRFHEPHGNDGGSYVYMTSALPTLVALTMKAFSSPTPVFVIWHLFSLACAAFIVVGLVWIIAPRTDWYFAMAIAVAAITTPLAIVQVEMIGMDVPMTALAVITLLLFVKQRYFAAALSATAAFFMKPTGVLVTATCICLIASRLLTAADSDRVRRRTLRRVLLAYLAAMSLQVLVYLAGGVHERLRRIGFADSFLRNVYYTCPDLGVLFLFVMLVGALWLLARCYRRLPVAPRSGNAPVALAALLNDRPELVFSGLLIAADLAAVVWYLRVFVIRYLLITIPFLYILLASLIYSRRHARAVALVPALLVGVNILNASGSLFPDVPGNHRHCSLLERSREYLPDHLSNIAAMRRLEARQGGMRIVAGYPYSYFLSLPRLGYVKQPLAGYAIMPINTPTFRPVGLLLEDHPTRLIFTSADNPSHRFGPVSPPELQAGDEIIYRDHLASPLIIYEKDLSALSGDAAALERWYAENLWGGGPLDLPEGLFASRARQLIGFGRPELASAMLAARIRRNPLDLSNRAMLGELLISLGRFEEAIQVGRDEVREAANLNAPNRLAVVASGECLIGRGLLRQGILDEALDHFAVALRSQPGNTQARFQTGVALLAKGLPREAVKQFSAVIAQDPNQAAVHYHFGLALGQLRQPAEAMAEYERALAIDPKFDQARLRISELLVNTNRAAAAVDYLRAAVASRPAWAEGLNALAWIMATSPEQRVRNGPQAVQYARKLCDQSQNRDAALLETLAAALAETGDYSQAVEVQKRAIALKQKSPDNLDVMQKRLAFYERQQPYRSAAQ